jgi:hypothetical protein
MVSPLSVPDPPKEFLIIALWNISSLIAGVLLRLVTYSVITAYSILSSSSNLWPSPILALAYCHLCQERESGLKKIGKS